MGIGFLYPRGGGELESISVTTPPSTTSYVTGSNFNPTGMVVTAYYSDRSSRSITGYTYSPITLTITNTAQSKTQTITISYTEGNTTVTTTTNVTVTNPVTSISITTQPTNRTAIVNSSGVATFNFSGAVVTATYTNGKTGTVTPTWSPTTYTISDTSTSKTVTVTASYSGKTTTTTMTASNPLSKIAITTQPSTRSYNVNSSGNCTFSFTGAKITATYTNTKTANVTSSTNWSPTTSSITDTTESKSVTVTASYGGKTATTTMTVNNPVTKITIDPAEQNYAEGATTSATTTATLTNGKTKTVTASRNPTSASKGNTSCTFSYGGKSASQTMHVYKQVYTGSTPTTKTFQASSLTKVGSFYANTSNSNGEAGMAYLSISISGYKKIKATWAASSGQYAIVYVGFKTSVATSGGTWYIPSDTNSKYTFANGTSVSKASQTSTIDCSSWTGTVYAHCHVYSGSTVSAVATSSITNITLWSS